MHSWRFPDLLFQAALAFMFKVGKIVVKNGVSVLARKASEGLGITLTKKEIKDKKYCKSKQVLRKHRNLIERNY